MCHVYQSQHDHLVFCSTSMCLHWYITWVYWLWFLTVQVCFHSTGYGLPQHVCADSSCSTCVYWLWSPQHVCVLVVCSTCVYCSWSSTARVCADSYVCVLCMISHSTWVCCSLQYVCELVMVSLEHVLTWLTATQLCSWQWFLHFLGCPLSPKTCL